MIIKPKMRGFICTTAHPVGCAENVKQQIEYVRSKPPVKGPKRVLVIGASMGFGLSSRIVSAFGSGAGTLGVIFDKPASEGRTGTAGWYNTAAFERFAREAGLYAEHINGDAFSDEVKQQAIEKIRSEFGQVDLVVYSLASPRRTDPKTGEIYNSVLKPIGSDYSNKTVDFHSGVVTEVSIGQATDEEIAATTKVMGGEDWELWIDTLEQAGVLAEGAQTVAYSYIGPEITHSIYREGTIGRAKDHLESTAHRLDARLKEKGGRAYVSVNKALVTQSSSAIPIVPLYISLLFKVMKAKGLHEGCIEQMHRLFSERLYSEGQAPVDEKGRIRVDDWEMRPDVQAAVAELWPSVSTENLSDISDIEGYREEFYKLFGFAFDAVDYEADVDPIV
jgi:enoyl-[acyl-carrier protein] reductase / trans-2-enoyl-CoA reductase (NAD+)